MKWSELIGKKIVAFRGITCQKSDYDKRKITELQYILFDDEETFIELNEQDPYDYHDCSHCARNLHLWKNAAQWKMMFDKKLEFNEPDDLGVFPF